MGTSGAYGGSNSTAWNAVREAWTGLETDDPTSPDHVGDASDPDAPDAQEDSTAYDGLGRLLGQALTPGYSPATPPSLPTLIARRSGSGVVEMSIDLPL